MLTSEVYNRLPVARRDAGLAPRWHCSKRDPAKIGCFLRAAQTVDDRGCIHGANSIEARCGPQHVSLVCCIFLLQVDLGWAYH